jgi:hypothetical protein
MRPLSLQTCLERLSFFLLIIFTILSISLAGMGIEVIIFNLFLAGWQPVLPPLVMIFFGGIGIFLSIVWRQAGMDYLHYSQHDAAMSFDEEETPSSILTGLIQDVEKSRGMDRMAARTKAKAWLIEHASSLDEEDVRLAEVHFGYLLPRDWSGSSRKI